MREIDDSHHAENEREPTTHQEQQRAVRNSIEGLDQPELRVHPCGGLRGRNGCASLPYDGSNRHLGRSPQGTPSSLRQLAAGWQRLGSAISGHFRRAAPPVFWAESSAIGGEAGLRRV